MCTLVVAFYPQSDVPLMVAANRDENPTRPSEPWRSRSFGNSDYYMQLSGMIVPEIYSPLDVRGGTWIGCNTMGIFCAITNWDIGQRLHGMKSRGDVVLETLKRNTKEDVFRYWYSLNPTKYKPFNILAGGADWFANLWCDNYTMKITPLPAGLHISTGIGLNKDTIREQHIKKTLRNAFTDFAVPVSQSALIRVMSDHNDGIPSEDSVCVHDDDHRWETRSSSFIRYNNDGSWLVRYIDHPPCHTTPEQWNNKYIPLYKDR